MVTWKMMLTQWGEFWALTWSGLFLRLTELISTIKFSFLPPDCQLQLFCIESLKKACDSSEW